VLEELMPYQRTPIHCRPSGFHVGYKTAIMVKSP